MTDPMQPQFWQDEDSELWAVIVALYIATFISGVESGLEAMPEELRPLVDVDSFNGMAMQYARQYRFTLINKINNTTRTNSQQTIFEWMQANADKLTLAAMLALIFSDARARMIARTEVTRIYALGNAAAWQSAGIRRVRWNTQRDERICPICAPRDGMVYQITDLGQFPPAHQNCRCWVEPVAERKAR